MPYHANLMRPYLPNKKRHYTRPVDDLETSGINWDAPYEATIEREKEICAPRNTKSSKEERSVTGSRLSRIVGNDGRPRKEWKMVYSDGQWVDDLKIQKKILANDYLAMTGVNRK